MAQLFWLTIFLICNLAYAQLAGADPWSGRRLYAGDAYVSGDFSAQNFFGNVSGATITDVSNQIPQDDLEYILSELWARPVGGGIEHALTDPQPFDFMVYSASTIINKSTAALGLGDAIYRDATDEVFYNLDLVSGKAVMDYMNLIENEIGPFREVYYVEGETPYSYKDHVAGVAHNNAGLVLLAGENGHIYRSPNYGSNWEDLGYLTTNVIRFIVFLGGQTWAFGDGAKIYRTQDDGDSWDAGTTTAVSQRYSMTPMLSGGAITASGNTVYRTLDAGTTWETLPVGMIGSVTPSFGSFAELLFIDTEGLGYDQVWAFGTITGGTNVILRSNDYGTTWTYDEVSIPAAMGEIARDSVTGNLYTSQANNVVSGLDVWESTDDGLTWSPLGLDSAEYYIYKIVPLRDGRILICTYPTGYIYQYRDGIWTRIFSPTFHSDKEHYPEFTDYLTDLGHGVVIGVFNEHWDTGDPDWFEIEAIHVLRSDKFESLELGTAAFRDAVDEFAADETLPSGTAVWKYIQTLPMGDHDHGQGTTGNLVKFATGSTGEITDSVLTEVDGRIIAPGEVQAATVRVTDGTTYLTLGIEEEQINIRGNRDFALRSIIDGNPGIIGMEGIVKFPDAEGDKIQFFSTAYALFLDPFTFAFRSDRDFRWDSDEYPNRMFLDEAGNLTVAGTISGGNTVPWELSAAKVQSSSPNWDTAYNERRQWDGGNTNLDAETGRNSLGLGSAALSLATDFAGAAHNHGVGTTGNLVKYATGGTGELGPSYIYEGPGYMTINSTAAYPYFLTIANSKTDAQASGISLTSRETRNNSMSTTTYNYAFTLFAEKIVNSATSTGYMMAHNPVVRAYSDTYGTVGTMTAMHAAYGMYGNYPGVVNSDMVIGYRGTPVQRTLGNITNFIDIYLENWSGLKYGTVTNRWGIYQVPTDAPNYLGSSLSIGTISKSNILTIQQTSTTDPIADEWTTYSTLGSKTDVSPVDAQKLTTASGRVKAVSMIEFKRPMPIDEPFPLDYFDLPIQDEEGNEIGVWTAEEQYEADLAEWKAALVNPKYNVPRLGVDANDPTIPAHWKSYGQDGQVMGVNLSAQVGDLLATVKAQQQAIEALQLEVQSLKARVSKLEGVKTP